MDEKIWSVKEVAQKLGVSTVTIRKWIKEGKIRAKRIGRPWHIPDSAVRAALETGVEKNEESERPE